MLCGAYFHPPALFPHGLLRHSCDLLPLQEALCCWLTHPTANTACFCGLVGWSQTAAKLPPSRSSLQPPSGMGGKKWKQNQTKTVIMGRSEHRLISKEKKGKKSKWCKSNFTPAQQQSCVHPTSKSGYLQQNSPPLVFLPSMMLCSKKYPSSQFRSAVPVLPILEYPLGENRVRNRWWTSTIQQ